jgi:hypothetical protein
VKKVAIAEGLSGLDAYFDQRGYTVVPPGEADTSVALIIAGTTQDFLGIQKRDFKGPVINAEGKTPEEIFRQVEKAFTIATAKPGLT